MTCDPAWEPTRFWARVVVAEDGCWLWTGGKNKRGYGVYREITGRKGKTILAHRFAYRERVGPIPKGLCVLHTCDAPACCNPSHLWLGTRADNNADKKAKGRSARGETHGMATLSEGLVREIRARLRDGESSAAIARSLMIAQSTVSLIKNRKRWSHLD